ncbi:MAG: class I SAM-dependent methyltransferase [Proteobacteria bacterium]|nr:class I SAM-dependent methyltransferase [Pseudomonadota bacterium]
MHIDRNAFPQAARIMDILKQKMFMLYKAATFEPRVPMAERVGLLEQVATTLIRGLDADQREARLAGAVQGYIEMSLEFLKLQRELERTGRYLLADERTAFENVYNREGAYGQSGYYLNGLLLAQALWPNHFSFWRLFRDRFASQLPTPTPRVLEVGVGTGFHFGELLSVHPDVRYTGVDVSQKAVDYCRRYVFGETPLPDHIHFVVDSISSGLSAGDQSQDALVMGEVLEHIEDPAGALREMWRVARPGAVFFLTTVVFAAAIDHIYLFENADQIRDLVAHAGWHIENELVLPVYPRDTPDMDRRPMNYAAVLRK